MTPTILDNFLSEDFFKHIQSVMFSEDFHWFYMDNIDYLDDVDKFQFTHAFYHQDSGPQSDHFKMWDFLFHTVKAKEIFNIKANLLTRTSKIVVNTFHTDRRSFQPGKNMTSIMYMNSNNGYTEFEDGTIVESVANRFISFPCGMKHRGTSCTDKKVRIVVNFNYIME